MTALDFSTQWTPDPETLVLWDDLQPDESVTVVKLDPNGDLATTYPGFVLESGVPAPWRLVSARWTMKSADVHGLVFSPGDLLLELFSPRHPFNVFFICSGNDHTKCKGWYANVTYPTRLERDANGFRLIWHDLYLDVVQLPDGRTYQLDDDELEESGLMRTDTEMAERIIAARDCLPTLVPALWRSL